jgi:hypothetical protein
VFRLSPCQAPTRRPFAAAVSDALCLTPMIYDSGSGEANLKIDAFFALETRWRDKMLG